MNIKVCERGCGKTSQDIAADIQPITATVKVNGSDETAQTSTLEVCKSCRVAITKTIGNLFTPAKIVIEVRQQDVCHNLYQRAMGTEK